MNILNIFKGQKKILPTHFNCEKINYLHTALTFNLIELTKTHWFLAINSYSWLKLISLHLIEK